LQAGLKNSGLHDVNTGLWPAAIPDAAVPALIGLGMAAWQTLKLLYGAAFRLGGPRAQ
jgi:hypothetical protein